MEKRSTPKPKFSATVFCGQLHALLELLEIRRHEILSDPDFNEGNEILINEMDQIVKKIAIIRECFEEFCPS